MIKKKMKIKHIIWWLIGLSFFMFIMIPSINLIFAHNLKDNKPEISKKLYEANVRYPSKFMKDESLYNLSESIINNVGKHTIFMTGWGGINLVDYGEIIGNIENYKEIIEKYPKSSYYELSYRRILDSYIYLGDSNNLNKWIKWGSGQDKDDINRISDLYKSYNFLVNREYEEAERILENYSIGDKEIDYMYYFLKGHIKFMEEDFNKALEYYENASEIGWQHGTQFFGNYVPDRRINWLEDLRYNNGDNKIRGRITVDDIGIPFAEVYLQYPYDGFATGGGDFIAISDKDGYFETIGIKDGEYDIGIGIGSHFINDKVYLPRAEYSLKLSRDIEFNFNFTVPMKVTKPSPEEIVKDSEFTVEWEEIEGADYYTIETILFSDKYNASSRFTIQYEEDEMYIKENKITLDLETLNKQSGVSTWGDDDSPINPETILGYFYSGAERPIIVNAYDKDGNMLSSSIPATINYENLPSVKIENGELTEGEKIILSMDYEEAIEFYEDRLSKDEEDEEALKYLSKIHMVDWKMGKKDFDKAEGYSERYYKLTGDKTLLNRTLEYKRMYVK